MNAILTAPAKFDRRAIAIAAWSLVKTAGKTLSEGMKAAWSAAKQTIKAVMNPNAATEKQLAFLDKLTASLAAPISEQSKAIRMMSLFNATDFATHQAIEKNEAAGLTAAYDKALAATVSALAAAKASMSKATASHLITVLGDGDALAKMAAAHQSATFGQAHPATLTRAAQWARATVASHVSAESMKSYRA